MFALEVLTAGGDWEMVAECFDFAEDAEAYYRNQLGGFVDFRVVEFQA